MNCFEHPKQVLNCFENPTEGIDFLGGIVCDDFTMGIQLKLFDAECTLIMLAEFQDPKHITR